MLRLEQSDIGGDELAIKAFGAGDPVKKLMQGRGGVRQQIDAVPQHPDFPDQFGHAGDGAQGLFPPVEHTAAGIFVQLLGQTAADPLVSLLLRHDAVVHADPFHATEHLAQKKGAVIPVPAQPCDDGGGVPVDQNPAHIENAVSICLPSATMAWVIMTRHLTI